MEKYAKSERVPYGKDNEFYIQKLDDNLNYVDTLRGFVNSRALTISLYPFLPSGPNSKIKEIGVRDMVPLSAVKYPWKVKNGQ